jgi:hypothetical protein
MPVSIPSEGKQRPAALRMRLRQIPADVGVLLDNVRVGIDRVHGASTADEPKLTSLG